MKKIKMLFLTVITVSLLYACGNNDINGNITDNNPQHTNTISEEHVNNVESVELQTQEETEIKENEELIDTNDSEESSESIESKESQEDLAKEVLEELKNSISFNLDFDTYEKEEPDYYQFSYVTTATNDEAIEYFTNLFFDEPNYTIDQIEDAGIIATNITCTMYDIHHINLKIQGSDYTSTSIVFIDEINMNSSAESEVDFEPNIDYTEMCFYEAGEILDDLSDEFGYTNRYQSTADYQEVYDYYYSQLEEYGDLELNEQTEPYLVNSMRLTISEDEFIRVELSDANEDGLPLVKFVYAYYVETN